MKRPSPPSEEERLERSLNVMCGVDFPDSARTIASITLVDRHDCVCCGGPCTHYGVIEKNVVIAGCSWFVRVWKRNPGDAFLMSARLRDARERAGKSAGAAVTKPARRRRIVHQEAGLSGPPPEDASSTGHKKRTRS